MATEAQILANRSNAQKSTGPRTAGGKAVVSKNAVKHGLAGRETVIQGEDPGEFEFYRERMLGELDPVGEMESTLAERIVSLSWRLQRAERLQAAAFDSLYMKQKHSLSEKLDAGQDQDADGDSTLGRAIVRDFSNCRVLDRLLMYERRIEHSLYRTMAELKRHRLLQEVGPGGIWELKRALSSDDAGGREQAVVAGEKTDGGEFVSSAGGMGNHGRDARATKPPAGGTASTPERASSRDAALQTSNITLQTSQTNPICPPPDNSQIPCGKEVTPDSPCDGPAETKPMPGTAEVSSLKFQVSSGGPLLQTSHFKLHTSPLPTSPALPPAESTCTRPAVGYNSLPSLDRVGTGVSSQE